MNFKALLWKEYRQSRQLLVSGAILLLFPYFVVVMIWLHGVVRYGQPLAGGWAHSIAISCVASLFISAILCPFLAAQVMAGERADRSAEFAGYLPIAREPAVIAKAVFAIGVGAFMLLANGLVGYLCGAVETMRNNSYATEGVNMLAPAFIVAVLTFGVSWLVSTRVSRPSTAAASGLASVFVFGLVLMFVEEAFGLGGPGSAQVMERVGLWLFLGPGIASFIAGTVCYLRRVEP